MLSIGWILVYDIITLCVTSRNIADVAFLGYTILFWEFLLIAYFGMLFSIFRNLAKADNPIKYKESTDWFYEGKNKNA